jgi:putative glutamine amidotransferase
MNPAPAGRPLIAVPARFSATASALRYEADAVARRLLDAVLAAGGEPLMVHPRAPGGKADDAEVASRLAFADALLLPGGADISPSWYGRPDHPAQYGVNLEQDAFDLAAFRFAVSAGIPIMAICRGAQLVNIATGGTLVQDMDDDGTPRDSISDNSTPDRSTDPIRDRHHRNRLHHVTPQAGSRVATTCGASFEVSCFHHQAIDGLGAGLTVTARAEDGTVEAYEMPGYPAWFAAVQWHPEDTAATDPAQLALFQSFVAAARSPVAALIPTATPTQAAFAAALEG